MKLYFAPGSVARASLIALCEVGAEFEPVRLDYAITEQQSPAYKAINPKGRVPSLVVGDQVMTETPAIMHYIAKTYPDAGLMPSDPWAQAEVHELMSYLASTVHVAHAHGMRGPRWARQESSFADMASKVRENMLECFQYIESKYLKGDWALGSGFSVADCHLFTTACWLERDGVDLASLPRVSQYMAAMQDRPGVIRALELERAA